MFPKTAQIFLTNSALDVWDFLASERGYSCQIWPLREGLELQDFRVPSARKRRRFRFIGKLMHPEKHDTRTAIKSKSIGILECFSVLKVPKKSPLKHYLGLSFCKLAIVLSNYILLFLWVPRLLRALFKNQAFAKFLPVFQVSKLRQRA